jgi:uncharacterized protein (TIGR02996 family)
MMQARQLLKKHSPPQAKSVTDPFVQALVEKPDDSNLWLVYADYLEERGDPRASFIRRCPVLPTPWGWEAGDSEGLAQELHRVLGISHSLYNKKVFALARTGDADDVLFLVEGAEKPLAVVHLTWARTPETDPQWPSTMFFSDWQDFTERCLNGSDGP